MSATKAERPNILVFLTDDHAQWAMHAYGNSELHTPSMDHLARSGARMANAFTPCPVCSPARASFHTGTMPSAHGVHDHIGELGAGREHPGIRGQQSLAELLQAQGYITGLVGKWHLNHFWEPPPGFTSWFSNATGTNARFGSQPFYDGSERVERFGNQAHVLADQALSFVRQHGQPRETDQPPFFLFVGFTNTHAPHSGEPERLVEHYRAATFADLPEEPDTGTHGVARFVYPTEAGARREASAQYYAAVTLIDEMIGRIVDELANLGITEQTLVMYTADHGHMNGHHGLHTKGNATVPQNFLEESIRIPALLSWPGHIAGGQVRDEPVDHCDLFMTVADAAGCYPAALRSDQKRPGSSCLPLLGVGRGAGAAGGAEEADPWRDAQFCEYGNARMIRSDNLKLIKRYPGPNGTFDDELYDLATDPRERENVRGNAAYAARAQILEQRLDGFFAQYGSERHSGLRVAELPRHNDVEPWFVDPASINPR